MSELPEFKFIADEPADLSTEGYFNFYHSYLAPALREIIKSPTVPKTIGIYGSWGTGKSTLIKMIQKDDELKNLPKFVFDAWKYQNDSLRRTFLINFKRFLITELEVKDIPADLFDDFYNDISLGETNNEKIKNTQPLWKRIIEYILIKNLTLTLSIIGVLLFLGVNAIWGSNPIVKQLQGLWGFLGTITILSIAAPEFVKSLTSKIVKDLTGLVSSQSKQITKTESRKALNSPEQFETKFIKLLEFVSHEKFIIVFDNIDRVPGDIAIAMLSTIKSFMEPESNSKIISIIPCDPDAINQRVKTFYNAQGTDSEDFVADEYLRKVFNLVLWLPSYLPNDLEEYTRKKLEQTGEIKKYTNTYDVIIVINAAFKKNPRDIIQFINNFTALVITVLQTDISKILLENIGYLAKVQVIRQKFPDEYKGLQRNWNEPESVAGGSDEFKQFMNATNRITVSDAEPFIFLKDPLNSRGISNYSEISESLQNNDVNELKKQIQHVDNQSLTNFTSDLLKKYRTIPTKLVNIFNTQFEGIFDKTPDSMKASYFHLLASLVDTDLWDVYKQINISSAFKLISTNQVGLVLRKAIVARFVQAMESRVAEKASIDLELSLEVIEQYNQYPKTFSLSNRIQISNYLETYPTLAKPITEKYAGDENMLNLFDNKIITAYVANSDYTQLPTTLATVKHYEKLFTEKKTLADLVSNIRLRFDEIYANNPGFSDLTIPIASSLSEFISKFKNNLKTQESTPDFEAISSHLFSSLSGAPDQVQKAQIVRAIWWLSSYVGKGFSPNNENHIENFIRNTDEVGITTFINFWSDEHKVDLIDRIFKAPIDALAVENLEVAKSLHKILSKIDQDKSDSFIKHIISTRAINPDQETDLLKNSGEIKDKHQILTALIAKLKANNFISTAYLDIFNLLANRGSKITSKEILADYLEYSIGLDDHSKITAAATLMIQLVGLNIPLKRSILASTLKTVKDSQVPFQDYTFARLSLLVSNHSLLEEMQKADLISIIKNGFSQQIDKDVTTKLYSLLLSIPNFSYSTYSGTFTDIFNFISGWSDQATTDEALVGLEQFKQGRLVAGEKAFWQSVDNKRSD